MNFEILDPIELLENNIFSEASFKDNTARYDWSRFKDKKVLVRGCTSTIIPPWAFMMIGARLTEVAQSIRFGNEHDNVTVYRRPK